MKTPAQKTYCPMCGEGCVQDTTIDHTATMRHEGKSYTVRVPALVVGRCDRCREVFLDNRASIQKQDALRVQLGRLTSLEIIEGRDRWDLSPSDVQDDIGITVETQSRWVNGHVIQTQANDSLLRAYLTDPDAFLALKGKPKKVVTYSLDGWGNQDEAKNSDEVAVLAANNNYALAA